MDYSAMKLEYIVQYCFLESKLGRFDTEVKKP
jgi:hypothetical protein